MSERDFPESPIYPLEESIAHHEATVTHPMRIYIAVDVSANGSDTRASLERRVSALVEHGTIKDAFSDANLDLDKIEVVSVDEIVNLGTVG